MKKRVKDFINTAKRSLTDLNYYKEVVKLPFKFSLKYLFFLLFILTLISSLKFASILGFVIPKTPQLIAAAKDGVKSLFPSGLVLTVRDGELSTNVKEPYYIDLPGVWGSPKDTHFITIDTKAKVDDIQSLNTLILLTKKSAVVKEKNNGLRVYPFSDIKETLVLDRDTYNQFVSRFLPYLDYLPKILIILLILGILVWPFVGAGLWLIGELFYLLITSVILLLIATLMKRKIRYSKLYQMSMHALTLPLLISFSLGFLGINLPFLIPTIILLLFMGFVISRFESR